MAGWNASHLAPKSFEWFFTFALCARPATGQRMGSGLPTELTMVLLVGFRSVGGHDRGGIGLSGCQASLDLVPNTNRASCSYSAFDLS